MRSTLQPHIQTLHIFLPVHLPPGRDLEPQLVIPLYTNPATDAVVMSPPPSQSGYTQQLCSVVSAACLSIYVYIYIYRNYMNIHLTVTVFNIGATVLS